MILLSYNKFIFMFDELFVFFSHMIQLFSHGSYMINDFYIHLQMI